MRRIYKPVVNLEISNSLILTLFFEIKILPKRLITLMEVTFSLKNTVLDVIVGYTLSLLASRLLSSAESVVCLSLKILSISPPHNL